MTWHGSRSALPWLVGCCLSAAWCEAKPPPRPAESAKRNKARPTVAKAPFGKLPDGRAVHLFTLANAGGMEVRLTDYGATTVGVAVPDRDGKPAEVTLGHATFEGWLTNSGYFGATVGRYANRIANATFRLDGKTYALTRNSGSNHIHGGRKGFDKRLWDAEPVRGERSAGVRFTYLSKDGEEGYPGNLRVTAVYSLTGNNELMAELSASTDKPTIVNLANHTYWNLAGPAAGDVLGHKLMLHADDYTVPGPGLIPTGEIRSVRGTPLDFTKPTPIGKRIAELKAGYDHNFVLRGKPGKLRLAAVVTEPVSGRVMSLYTDQPAVQLYTGNHLRNVKGAGGVTYRKHHGFCLETQHYPDSPNRKTFPSPVLRPGQTYRHTMVHRFSVE